MINVQTLSRYKKQLIMLVFDACALIAILLVAFSIRLGVWFVPEAEMVYLIYFAPLIALPIFIYFKLYQTVVRFIGLEALWAQAQALSLYALLWGVITFMSAADGIPRSVILINWALSLLLISGSRLIARWFFGEIGNNGKKIVIYGAGSAGRQLLRALKSTVEYKPMAFVDDDKNLRKSLIDGVEVIDQGQLAGFIEKHQIKEALLAIPSISHAQRRKIINFLQEFPVKVRVLPGLSQLASGKVHVRDLQQISISDLLGRNKVDANQDLLSKNITGKVVCVTGAGGSIGTELCRQIAAQQPKILILYELNEFALYQINQELAYKDIQILPMLGSVIDKPRLIDVFKQYQVESIYHAAAYKHVPMVEFNTTQGANNNIFGTLNCALAAIEAQVKTFVFISTDKAVRPTNTMGTTKRFGELILQALATQQTATNFAIVRFGNVLGSSGSVIPLFTQQIKNGGPITVTDENISRYFMTIAEAVALVIQAGSMSLGGEVFVLDMGEAIKINNLAKKMVHLSGLQVKNADNPDGDIEIQYTGLRPGEKLYEELLIGDNIHATEHPMIMRAQEDKLTWAKLDGLLSRLKNAIDNNNSQALRQLLIETVPDFKPQCQVVDLLSN